MRVCSTSITSLSSYTLTKVSILYSTIDRRVKKKNEIKKTSHQHWNWTNADVHKSVWRNVTSRRYPSLSSFKLNTSESSAHSSVNPFPTSLSSISLSLALKLRPDSISVTHRHVDFFVVLFYLLQWTRTFCRLIWRTTDSWSSRDGHARKTGPSSPFLFLVSSSHFLLFNRNIFLFYSGKKGERIVERRLRLTSQNE